jgi:hypothetical protein
MARGVFRMLLKICTREIIPASIALSAGPRVLLGLLFVIQIRLVVLTYMYLDDVRQ